MSGCPVLLHILMAQYTCLKSLEADIEPAYIDSAPLRMTC